TCVTANTTRAWARSIPRVQTIHLDMTDGWNGHSAELNAAFFRLVRARAGKTSAELALEPFADGLHMALIRATAAAQHVERWRHQVQPVALAAKVFGVAFVQVGGIVQFLVTAAGGIAA